MWEQLIGKINTTLGEVPSIKDVFSVPKTKLTKFPCVFFKPLAFANNFNTNRENDATYRFLMLVMVGASGTTIADAFGTVLPHAVDDIINKFNADWNQGTIDGHRVRVKIDSADEWAVSEEQDGLVAYAPMNVEIRLLTTN
jgi:hypothetical protein